MAKRQIVRDLSSQVSVRLLCRVLGISRSTFYYRPRASDDLTVLAWIEDVLVRFPTYGYRRVTAQLHREGHPVNHKRIHRVMKENDLIAVVKRRCKTTDSRHSHRRYPNLLRGLDVVRPDQVWCADITYIQVQRDFVYLAILLDLFTRGLRGWHLGRTLSSELAVTALEKALHSSTPEIHHSDQGVQYAAQGYIACLQQGNIQVSMTARQQATENAHAERVIRTIKEEEVYLTEYESFHDAYHRIGHFIEDVYQHKRIHSALGYLTPTEFEAAYWQRPSDTP